MPSLPKKRRWTLPTALVSGPTPIHTRFRTQTTRNWTGTIQGFTFFLGSRVISQPCFPRTSWMPQCGRAKSLKWNQIPPVLSTPATRSSCGTCSRTSSGSKLQCHCQLCNHFWTIFVYFRFLGSGQDSRSRFSFSRFASRRRHYM